MRQRGTRAFTLIELMVVIGIMGMILGASIYGLRSLTRSELRGSASKLGGAIRYCFDRSITTGAYFRIVLDLDKNTYWAERSDDRMYLARDKEQTAGSGKAFDLDAEEKKRAETAAKEQERLAAQSSVAKLLEPPPTQKRARFQSFKDASLPQIKLKKIRIFDVYTPRQPEPYTTGRAYLYFFPDGHTERAVVRLSDGDDFYSLVVSPLTGRVEVRSGKYEIPKDFDERPLVAQ